MINFKISIKISECWYHEFLKAFTRIRPYGVYTLLLKGKDDAPDYVVEYLFDKVISDYEYRLILKAIFDEFPAEVCLEVVTDKEYRIIGKTYEPKFICNIKEVYDTKMKELEASHYETCNILNRNIEIVEQVMSLYPGKRNNSRLTLQSTKLFYEYVKFHIEHSKIVSGEINIAATYKNIENFSIRFGSPVGDYSTIFRNLTNAKTVGLISISDDSNANSGTVWRIKLLNLNDTKDKMMRNSNIELSGAKIGRTSYSQVRATKGKNISDNVYIVKNKDKQINRADFDRVSRKISELRIAEVVFEQDILESLNDFDRWVFENCRATICNSLKLRRMRYTEAKIEVGGKFKKHGNSIVYVVS